MEVLKRWWQKNITGGSGDRDFGTRLNSQMTGDLPDVDLPDLPPDPPKPGDTPAEYAADLAVGSVQNVLTGAAIAILRRILRKEADSTDK